MTADLYSAREEAIAACPPCSEPCTCRDSYDGRGVFVSLRDGTETGAWVDEPVPAGAGVYYLARERFDRARAAKAESAKREERRRAEREERNARAASRPLPKAFLDAIAAAGITL